MSTSREKLDAWHAELDRQQAERMAARARERQQRLANPVQRAATEPSESSSVADHETARGIRSIWD